MTLLAAARDLPQNVIPATKPQSGRPPKTSKHSDDDDVRRQELCRNHHLDASELKEMHQDHLGNVSIRFIEHRPKKGLKISSQHAASKTLLIGGGKKVMWSDESTVQCISSNEYRTF